MGTQERPVGNLASQKGYGSEEIHFKTQQNYFYLRLMEMFREEIGFLIATALKGSVALKPYPRCGPLS